MSNSEVSDPEKIFIVAGLPRSGKRLLVDMLGSHSEISIPPIGLAFQNIFSQEKFNARGGIEENLDFLINSWSKNNTLKLIRGDFKNLGNSRKDFYLAILEAYRAKYFPNKKYFGEYSHHTEEHYDTWVDWFGPEKLKFMYVIRNPFENYASFITSRKIPMALRNKWLPNPAVNNFCSVWADSASIGLYRSQKYPAYHRVFFFEDIVDNTENFLGSLCEWLDVPMEIDRMLQMVDYDVDRSSIFDKYPEKRAAELKKIDTGQKFSPDRRELLSDYEIDVIGNMTSPNVASTYGYDIGKQKIKLHMKQVLYNENILPKDFIDNQSWSLFLTYRLGVSDLKMKDQIVVFLNIFRQSMGFLAISIVTRCIGVLYLKLRSFIGK